jgi:hypothetical protein
MSIELDWLKKKVNDILIETNWLNMKAHSDHPEAETATYITHNTHKRETSMPSVGFERAIPASEWPQTHALDRETTGIGTNDEDAYMNNSVDEKGYTLRLA